MAETPSMSIEELLEHRSFVRRLAIRLAAGDTHLADDIAQETWLRTVKSPPPRADSVRAWLARVLRNVMSSEMRSRTRRAIREAAAEDAREEIEPKDALARQEVVARILQALVALDEVSRQVVLLRFYEDLPPRRIAELLDLPVETVRTRTRRALAALRAQLDASDLKEWRALFLPLPVMGATGAASSFEELKGAGSSLVPKAATLVLLASAVIVSWTILSGGGTSSKLKSVDAVSESAPSGAGPASDGEALEPEALTAIRQGTLPSLKGRSPMATSPAASSIAGATVSFRQAPEPPLSPATSEEPGVIRGRIVGPDGSPVPDAALAIRKVSTIEGGGQRRHRDQEGPLPVDGAATFEWRAPDGESRWEVEGEIRRTGLVIEHFIAAVEPGGVTDLGDISLRPAARVSGRVITPAGEPIAEARIELRGARPIEDEEEARATGFESELRIVGEELGGEADRSDADGRFTIDHLSPGAWRAWACTNETEYDFSEALTLSGGEVVEVELTLRALRPERTIRGVVRHQDGSPALDARVTVESTDQRFQRSARADEQGRFILYSARLESVLLFAEDESLVSDRHEVRFGESTTEILGTPRTRELIASDEGGNPIEALAALVMAPATSAPLLDLLLPIHGEGFMSMSGSNLPDFIWRSRSEGSDGRMQLRVPRESFRLFVEAPGFRRFELPSCSPTGDEPIAITMTRLPGITGFVRNSSGPVPGAVLTLTRVSERPVLYHQT
ncbi:MAG: sigma-70 family RNA polymerase sigma factor, partial [Planctomycetota bacterium]